MKVVFGLEIWQFHIPHWGPLTFGNVQRLLEFVNLNVCIEFCLIIFVQIT